MKQPTLDHEDIHTFSTLPLEFSWWVLKGFTIFMLQIQVFHSGHEYLQTPFKTFFQSFQEVLATNEQAFNHKTDSVCSGANHHSLPIIQYLNSIMITSRPSPGFRSIPRGLTVVQQAEASNNSPYPLKPIYRYEQQSTNSSAGVSKFRGNQRAYYQDGVYRNNRNLT